MKRKYNAGRGRAVRRVKARSWRNAVLYSGSKGAEMIGRFAANKIGNAWKTYKSRTATKTVTKYKKPNDYASGSAIYKTMKISLRKAPKGVDWLTRWSIRDGRAGGHAVTTGRQTAYLYYVFGSRSQMLNATGSPAVGVADGQYPFFNLNPNERITGNQNAGFVDGGSSLVQNSIFWDSLSLDMEFTNGTNTATFIDLYIVMPKQSQASDPVGDWIASVATENYGLVTEGFPLAGGSVVTATPGNQSTEHVGAKPTESKAWNQAWKVIAKRTLLLSQGGSTERLKVYIKMNKVLKYQRVSDDVNQYQGGTTISVFGIQRGGVINDQLIDVGTYSNCFTPHVCQATYVIRNMKVANGKQEIKVGYSRIPVGVPAQNLTQINTESVISNVVTTQ